MNQQIQSNKLKESITTTTNFLYKEKTNNLILNFITQLKVHILYNLFFIVSIMDNNYSQFNEKNTRNVVSNYNNELWITFFIQSERYIQSKPSDKQPELFQSLDLLRAINSYRVHPTIEELLAHYPELNTQQEYVSLLWNHFSAMGNEQLSDLAIQMIEEVL